MENFGSGENWCQLVLGRENTHQKANLRIFLFSLFSSY